MSPVFRHGRLRLYLLKLLDEAPRHGYEVIRLLQDRFLGVYAPSPGTIYPRLARLEEEGLVTHDEVDGKKVYRITEKGREELRARVDDLAELEEEITASVWDIAQEVSEDVRATVRSLREELTSAAREMRGRPRTRSGGEVWEEASAERGGTRPARGAGDRAREAASSARDRAREAVSQARERARQEAGEARERARAQREDARAQRDQAGDAGGRDETRQDETPRDEARRGWGRSGWGDWADWADWPGRRGYPGHSWGDPHAYRDMEKLARQFSREFRRAAEEAHAVGEEAVVSLRAILEDALDRIRNEVFGPGQAGGTSPDQPGDSGESQS